MPRPGFSNDNEYRSYPFVHKKSYTGAALPDATIVDIGLIMGIDSAFDAAQHSVWLSSISRSAGNIAFTFETDANNTPLVFTCPEATDEWSTVYAESADPVSVSSACNPAPVWEGYIVVGKLTDILAQVASNATQTYSSGVRVIEPARVQSLLKHHVRSVNVGNFSRVIAQPTTDCQEPGAGPPVERSVVANAACMQGALQLKEGYNCRIQQISRTNELAISAERNAGEPNTAELCGHGSELPFYANEPFDPTTGFYSGGPACNQTIATINGVSGANARIVGGTGVRITANQETHTITVALTGSNITGNCAT